MVYSVPACYKWSIVPIPSYRNFKLAASSRRLHELIQYYMLQKVKVLSTLRESSARLLRDSGALSASILTDCGRSGEWQIVLSRENLEAPVDQLKHSSSDKRLTR